MSNKGWQKRSKRKLKLKQDFGPHYLVDRQGRRIYPDSTHLLMRACISLKIDKLNKVIHENSKNLNCEIDVLGTC